MKKITLHQILFIIVFSLVAVIARSILISKPMDFWPSLFEFATGYIFSIFWSLIFYKPEELKDKYK